MERLAQESDWALPDHPGLYLLLIRLHEPAEITIGGLGRFHFNHGCYAYIGSARGPGGLSGRIKRHLRTDDEKRSHWHIDYLLTEADIREVGWSIEPMLSECEWSLALGDYGRQWPPRFGASDCRCPGHLIQFEDLLVSEKIAGKISDQMQFIRLH